jgi:hypothetical protein
MVEIAFIRLNGMLPSKAGDFMIDGGHRSDDTTETPRCSP